jgi:hypothetical protein
MDPVQSHKPPSDEPCFDQQLWQQVLRAAVASQRIIPEAVAVGGTAAALVARHRLSVDTDHLLPDLKNSFDAVRKRLEASEQWQTARIQPPVLILGSLQNVEIGFRQMRRSLPIESVNLETTAGILRVPTLDELIGMKAYLAYSRRATRDYLDFAALSSLAKLEDVLDTLHRSQHRYGELQSKSVALEIAKTLSDPKPYDLDDVDLTAYKGIQPPWNHWDPVAAQCRLLGMKFGEALMTREKEI